MVYVDKNRMLYDILKGDIFRVKADEKYIMHESGMCAALFKCIDSMQSNNGNFRAVDEDGKLYWFNTVTDTILLYKRTKEVSDERTAYPVTPTEEVVKASKVIRISNPVNFHATWDELDAAEDRCLPNDSDF